MNKEEILYWKEQYAQQEDLYNTGLEGNLRRKFQTLKVLAKDDLKEIIKWKFQGQLKGRQLLNLRRLEDFNASIIEKISRLVFEIDSDRLRLKLLSVIDGVGCSVASVVLTFYDPWNYGVLDFHAWNGLFHDNKKTFTEKDCLGFFEKLREISRRYNLPCRDIEKAYFEKDKNQSRSRDNYEDYNQPGLTNLKQVKIKLAEEFITDPHQKYIFLQKATQFKQWANYIAALVLTKEGQTEFTPKDIRNTLKKLLGKHFNGPGAKKSSLLTADVEINSKYHEGLSSLKRIKGTHQYQFIGF